MTEETYLEEQPEEPESKKKIAFDDVLDWFFGNFVWIMLGVCVISYSSFLFDKFAYESSAQDCVIIDVDESRRTPGIDTSCGEFRTNIDTMEAVIIGESYDLDITGEKYPYATIQK